MRALTGISIVGLVIGTLLVMTTGPANDTQKGDPMNSKKPVLLYSVAKGGYVETARDVRSTSEWRDALTDQQYRILRRDGTERAFTGALYDEHRKGIYRCAGCGTDLFFSDAKFDSGTGWPSFWKPVAPENIREVGDTSLFMRRVEVECTRCGGHLGHVFQDGPEPTGLRYCINSASLTFTEGLFPDRQGTGQDTGGA